MALIRKSDLEARIGRDLTTEEATAFTTLVAANERYLEDLIGSSLTSTTPTTRLYDGGLQHTPIDPCTSVTAIAIVDDDAVVYDTLDTTDYTVEPVNKTLKTMVRYRNGRLPVGINNVRVSATFSLAGDSGATAIAKNALLDMLTDQIENKDNVVRESIEGYTVEFGNIKESESIKALRSLIPPVL